MTGTLLLVACASSSRSSPASDVNPRDPLSATRLMEQGLALVGQRKVAEGLNSYNQALKLQPKNPTIHNLIGVAELQRGEAVKALDAFNRALALAPSYSDARSNRGTAYVQLGQYAMAETDFFAVLGDPTYANRTGVYFNLGALYLGRGNFTAAEENLRRAAVPSGPVEAYLLLGQVEERLAKPAAAESTYREAVARAPERPEIAFALGRLLEAQGRANEAREIYRKILEVAPGSREAAQVRGKLGQ
ncbi:MAG: tetratricopeptide repeat protein [Thermoanaerobaculales bacterium]